MTTSLRGGSGKSTILSNLASYFALLGMRVIIIDADIISPGIHAIFGLDKESFSKTMTDYLLGKGKIEDAAYDISDTLDLPEGMIYLVPSSMLQSNIAELIQLKKHHNRLVKAISILDKAFEPDFIMIDTHPGLNEEVIITSEVSDVLLTIVRPDNQDYQGLQISAAVSKKLNLKTYVVLNKVHPKMDTSKLRKMVTKSFNLPVAGALPFSEDLILAQSQYVFSERHPEHPFSREIHRIALSVFGVRPKEQLQILYDLLKAIKEKKQISVENIITKKILPPQNFQEYIDDFVAKGFIQETTDKKGNMIVSITKKGARFLKKYKVIRKFVNSFRL